jgi:tetratricopeptide (TPR) repeat protein
LYKAIKNFLKALEINPEIIKEPPSIPYNIAISYVEIEHFDEAIKFLNKSLELDPEYEPAKKLKARISG